MRDGFPPGSWGTGSPGDPDLDALLPAAAVESLLDGAARGVPEELAPLADTLAALRAAPPTVDLGAEERALAAFRALRASGALGSPIAGTPSGPAGPNGPDLLAHTLELEVPHGRAVGRQRGRARHRARPAAEARPATRGGSHSGRSRPSAGRRLALAIATTAAAFVILGVFAYTGHLPGMIQRVAHEALGAPSADRSATASSLPSSHGGNGGGNGSGTLVTQSSTSAPSSATTTGGPGTECLAYFQNPQRPGAKSWDKPDWEKLAAAVHPSGDIRAVWQYCHGYLVDSNGNLPPNIFVMPAHGRWPIPEGADSRQDGNAQNLRLP